VVAATGPGSQQTSADKPIEDKPIKPTVTPRPWRTSVGP